MIWQSLWDAEDVLFMQPSVYPIYRPEFYTELFSAAQHSDAKGMMPWELVAWHVAPTDSGGYDFGIDDVSFGPLSAAIAYQKQRVRTNYCVISQSYLAYPGTDFTQNLLRFYFSL